ncbi:hypothetical protein IAU59_004387 [Kwoniella sp. CBS 9459]
MLGVLSFSGPSMSDDKWSALDKSPLRHVGTDNVHLISAISGLGGGGQATPHTANQASAVQYALSSVFAIFGGPIIHAIRIVGGCMNDALGSPLSGTGFLVLSKYQIQWYLIFAKVLYGMRERISLAVFDTTFSSATVFGLPILVSHPQYASHFLADSPHAAVHCSVRTRALSSRIAPVSSIVLQPIFGYILDQQRRGPRAKGMAAYIVYIGVAHVMVVWGFNMIAWFKRQNPDLRLDFHNDSARWFAAYAPSWMYFVFSYVGQIYVYWILGQFASNVTSNARTGGVYRSWETVGQAVSYGMYSQVKNEYVPIGVLPALTVACAPGLWMIVKGLPENSKEIVVADANDSIAEAVDDKVTRA